MNKKDLFHSFSSRNKNLDENIQEIKPPYCKNSVDFDRCIECEEKPCIKACEENIIKANSKGIVYLDFSKNGCTYCDECANVCDKNVLNLEYKKHINISIKIDTKQCMSWNKTMCFSCKDPCLDDAIYFSAMFKPIINYDKCTSCGFCIGICPSDAIVISKIFKESTEHNSK